MIDYTKRRKSFAFKFSKLIVRIITRKPKYKFLGKDFNVDEPFLFIVNHCGKKSPLKLEMYFPKELRIWGTHEMTEGYKSVHKYLTKTYYHEKKHLPKVLAWIVGTIVSPFVAGFYKGMRITPTYPDVRFIKTLKESMEIIENNINLVIFPEDSNDGYKNEITHFFSGFVRLLEHLKKRNIDLLVYVGYLNKKKNTFIVNEPKRYSEIKLNNETDDEIANKLREELNSLHNYPLK